MKTRIVGIYNWHDANYCVFENGTLIEHSELERYIRLKETPGDSLKYLKEVYLEKNNLTINDIDKFVSVLPDTNLCSSGKEHVFDTHNTVSKDDIIFYPHHLCHAAHAYYSSKFNDSYVLSIDSAGLEDDGRAISVGGYIGTGNKLKKVFDISSDVFSLGNLWGKCTRYIFKLQAGYPMGHQAGSVMAMAAMGDYKKYYGDFKKMASSEFNFVKFNPMSHARGVYTQPEDDNIHPYLDKYRKIAEQDEQEKFNMASSLQRVTEDLISQLVSRLVFESKKQGFISNNICFSGGVSLNSVSMGKIVPFSHKASGEATVNIDNIFIPPVPYDGGMTIGACQYHWFNVLGNKKTNSFVSPYLGEVYSLKEVSAAIDNNKDRLAVRNDVALSECVDLIVDDKIVAVFNGRSESGRRALGNRSILASPKNPNMKDMINKKVKHRQWYRPFAPSVLEEFASEWFDGFFPSPYMSFVFNFKEDKLGQAPAVEHFNGTARIQSVSREYNNKYYDLIYDFYKKTGIPMVLNTSFNDREPICEKPIHAIECFLRTEIDYLYFADFGILVAKKDIGVE
jgi:carbamoyltransferase